ncbi:MAG TPA: TadE/TadG family type IV pilus assembly protein [Streptosporangiaceae bacterium]|jgi:Flp pilus assembly protein TadG
MTVEFVLLAPVIILLMLFLLMAGRVVEANGQVGGAARDAARAASVARSTDEANQAAQEAVSSDIHQMQCGGPQLSGFVAGSAAVTVQLKCDLSLSPFGFGSLTITGSAVAPLDPLAARTFGG